MASAEQDQWQEITAAMRAHLAKMLKTQSPIKPDDLATLAKVADDLMWAEIKAATFDELLEERRKTLEREATYGG